MKTLDYFEAGTLVRYIDPRNVYKSPLYGLIVEVQQGSSLPFTIFVYSDLVRAPVVYHTTGVFWTRIEEDPP